jgi:hypothetical protein
MIGESAGKIVMAIQEVIGEQMLGIDAAVVTNGKSGQ